MLEFKLIKTFILALIVGFIGGIQGQAGTLYILSGLLMFNIVSDARTAAGTALLYTSIPVTFGAAYEYHKRKQIDWKVSLILIPTVIIASIMGAKINPLISEKYILYSIGVSSMIATLYFFNKAYNCKK